VRRGQTTHVEFHTFEGVEFERFALVEVVGVDETVTLFRVLANPLRLRVHRAVHDEPGIPVSRLAARLAVREVVVSQNLRILQAAGLVASRPSGRFVHVHPVMTPRSDRRSSAVAGRLLTTLWEKVGDAEAEPALVWEPVGSQSAGGDPKSLTGAIVFVCTAYTHLRRLLILRLLAQAGPLTQETVAEEIGMSAPALTRHLSKLLRRGVVRRVAKVPGNQWQLVERPGTQFQRALHRMVLEQLLGEKAAR